MIEVPVWLVALGVISAVLLVALVIGGLIFLTGLINAFRR